MSISNEESSTTFPSQSEKIKLMNCNSCGFTEECTLPYICRIKERYKGNWICGLCIEAVKDEVLRSEMTISTEEALNRHVMFCKKFKSFEKTEHPMSAMVKVIRRSLSSERGRQQIVRSESCFSSLSR